jgi:caulimovirus viroplasmin
MAKVYAYYLVNSDTSGILESWEECKKVVLKKKARYKSFENIKEAQEWLDSGAKYEKKEKNDIEIISKIFQSDIDCLAIYFDAGTGRGNGVEVRLSDYKGNPLLYKILPKEKINEFGNYYVAKHRTNNFGELVGLYAALVFAKKYDIKKIMGDSSLVLDYWSMGRYNAGNLESDTIELIKKVTLMRKKFENQNGIIKKISGDINPADLGFHK